MTTVGERDQPAIEVADLVLALKHLGRIVRAPVRRGTTGVVTARQADGTLLVAFSTGHSLRLDPTDVGAVSRTP